jgi:uncharacterized protein (TIGR02453 family)
MPERSILEFLQDLQVNNNKPWFDAHRPQYEAAKSAFHAFVEELIAVIAQFDPTIGALEAKQCTFRINRDVRFSKDKRPYKHNMSAYFNHAGKKGTGAGYYLHIEPGKSFAAAGLWMPEPANLAKIRQEIDYNHDEWKKILGSAAFKKQFAHGLGTDDSLVRPPKGYDEENPAIRFLKMKSFVASRSFSDSEVTGPGFHTLAGASFKAAKPMIGFLNRAVDE